MSKSRAAVYFLLIVLAWGGSFLGIHYALQNYPPIFGALLRCLVCLLAVTFYMLLFKKRFRYGRYALASVGIGMIGMGLAWICLFSGEKYIPPALASIINGTVPIFIIILTPFITPSDQLNRQKIIGVIFGFMGIVTIFWPDIRAMQFSTSTLGMMFILGMALSYSTSILVVRRLLPYIDATANIFYQSIGAVFILFIATYLLERGIWPQIIWELNTGFYAALYLGIFPSAMAFILFNQLIKHVGSVQAGVVTLCVPLVSILLDMVALKSFLNFYQALGAIMIFMSLAVINKLVRWPLMKKSQ